jgi:tetratricopeptide (TPR) repeat protein
MFMMIRDATIAISVYRFAPRIPDAPFVIVTAYKPDGFRSQRSDDISRNMQTSPATASLLKQAVGQHRAGALPEAASLYRQVLVLDARQPDATHNLGAVLAQQGNLPEALPFLLRALDLEAGRPKYWSVCIDALVAAGHLDQAVEVYRRLIALQPRLAAAQINLGQLLLRLERRAEAAACFRAALKLNPAMATAHNNLGNLAKLDGKLDEAAKSYRAAAAADPTLAEPHDNLGVLLEQAGELEAAENRFRHVIALAPDYPAIHRKLGAVLLERGRTGEALEEFLRHAYTDTSPADDSDHKWRHDAEQTAWRGSAAPTTLTLDGGARLAGPAVNAIQVRRDISAQWNGSPKLAVIDDLLTPDALASVRQLCLGSNFWRRSFPNGYLGALPEHGFAAPILAQIGEELPRAFPEIFGSHPLLQLWAFKYDSELSGINLHADFAAVNVNFWITPDEANLDPGRGGLVVWNKEAPLEWDFARYNTDERAMRDFLAVSGARPVTVPYRANRAVIFDSDLFHETDRFQFRPGYESRRINITYLYGWRGKGTRG